MSGGSIGWALAAATGAAVACPGRKTICLHGDGGAVMALQALWTQARENLDVTTVIFSNRAYAILDIEMARAGFDIPGPLARSLFDLGRPALDWVKLAEGMGVEASRAESVGAFADQFASAVRGHGPAPHRGRDLTGADFSEEPSSIVLPPRLRHSHAMCPGIAEAWPTARGQNAAAQSLTVHIPRHNPTAWMDPWKSASATSARQSGQPDMRQFAIGYSNLYGGS